MGLDVGKAHTKVLEKGKNLYLFEILREKTLFDVCIESFILMHKMRTTIDIPEELVFEAMKLTQIKTKTDVIKEGLNTLIRKEKLKNLKNFKGVIDLDINLKDLRKR